jgi:hypothetical protein
MACDVVHLLEHQKTFVFEKCSKVKNMYLGYPISFRKRSPH